MTIMENKRNIGLAEVSVIIPTHNRGKVLAKTLGSYLSDPSVLEVIIVNDGSTDDSEATLRAIAEQEPRVRLFSKANGGAPSARNHGIAHTSPASEYIFFGEDDAFLDQNAITTLLACLNAEGADLAGGRIIPIDAETSDLVCPPGNIVEKNPVTLNLMRANFSIDTGRPVPVPFMHALFLARKAVFAGIRFDEHYFGNAYREETDFCLQAARNGAKIIFCPASRLYHIEAPTGGQRRIGKLSYEYAVLKNNWYFLGKHYDYLRQRYHLITPKWGLQGLLILRRIYLLIAKMIS